MTAHSRIEIIQPSSIERQLYRQPKKRRDRIVSSGYVKITCVLLLLVALVVAASPIVRLVAVVAVLCLGALLTSICLWVQNNVR